MTFGNRQDWVVTGAFLAVIIGLAAPASWAQGGSAQTPRVTLDFNEVELPVFVRFMSELTGKNFVLDDSIKKTSGKVSLFSPTKVTVDQAYNMFLAALEVSRLTAVPKGNIIQIVQTAEVPPERSVYVYKLKNANATDTVAILTNLVAKSQVLTATPGGRPPLRPLSEFEAPVQVFADKATNSVIISGTKTAYSQLKSVLQSLDTRRKQVFVEAVILEVQVDRLRQIGTDPIQVIGVGKFGPFQGIAGLNRPPEDISTLALAILGGSAASGSTVPVLDTVTVRVFMQFLMNLTDTNVLSTPQVLAADNQKAKIVVGENRPFPTGQAQGITGGTLVTIERKDVGVTLEMTPQVLENEQVRLEIKQEITAIAENVSQTIGSGNASIPVGPTTTKRSMETTTIAQDHHTLVIGGLVRDNVVFNERKIPLLGDIPFLGWFFKSQTKAVEKLILLVFITPHIIKDEADMVELNVRKAVEVETLQRENRIEDPTRVKQQVIEQLQRNGPQPLPHNGMAKEGEVHRDLTPSGVGR